MTVSGEIDTIAAQDKELLDSIIDTGAAILQIVELKCGDDISKAIVVMATSSAAMLAANVLNEGMDAAQINSLVTRFVTATFQTLETVLKGETHAIHS